MLVSLKVPKALALPFLQSCSPQKHKANLFCCFKTSKCFSRTLFYAFQHPKTSSMPSFLNFKLQKHQWYLFPAFSLIWSFLNAKYMRCTFLVSLQSLKTALLHFFKHFHIFTFHISGTLVVSCLSVNTLILPFCAFLTRKYIIGIYFDAV